MRQQIPAGQPMPNEILNPPVAQLDIVLESDLVGPPLHIVPGQGLALRHLSAYVLAQFPLQGLFHDDPLLGLEDLGLGFLTGGVLQLTDEGVGLVGLLVWVLVRGAGFLLYVGEGLGLDHLGDELGLAIAQCASLIVHGWVFWGSLGLLPVPVYSASAHNLLDFLLVIQVLELEGYEHPHHGAQVGGNLEVYPVTVIYPAYFVQQLVDQGLHLVEYMLDSV